MKKIKKKKKKKAITFLVNNHPIHLHIYMSFTSSEFVYISCVVE